MLGLKRGTVELSAYHTEWSLNAAELIEKLKLLLGATAVDIQHIGSTAIPAIYAKPIIDIAVGVRELSDIVPYIDLLKEEEIIFRGEDVAGQLLLVIGDFENDTRTHHIHIVEWNSQAWNNYIKFRDLLNQFPDKAKQYDDCKKRLAEKYPNDRNKYSAEKQKIIISLLNNELE